MTAIITKPGTDEKLRILSEDAQYDLACACGTKDKDEHRQRGGDGKWVYPVTLPNGGKSIIFKTLMSNVCSNDCKYCPLRSEMNARRVSLSADETARVFLDYYRRKKVFGLFLSSGVCGGSADATMERLNGTARLLRNRYRFRGMIHLKVIPGASNAAIEEAVSLASNVSLNIETAGAKRFSKLSDKKNYLRDIIAPIKLISRLTGKGMKHSRVKQTTQFIVGAAGESDAEIVKYMGGLYDRINMSRIYFSAYQRGLGDPQLPGEREQYPNSEDMFSREHRLYQVDFLLRKYGFSDSDIIFGGDGKLSLDADPKEIWARNHPEFFPVNVNKANKNALLKVPGLGPITVGRILKRRKTARLSRIEDVGKVGALLQKAAGYVHF
ncbi:MAG: hypothetical protein KAS23_08655 [Anaerohalosphaera sp.]|nr:hypothetical protein [Anaerohalosphaera sp.]